MKKTTEYKAAKAIADSMVKVAEEAGVKLKINLYKDKDWASPAEISLASNRKSVKVEMAASQISDLVIVDSSAKERKFLLSLKEPARTQDHSLLTTLSSKSSSYLQNVIGINYPTGTKFELFVVSSKTGKREKWKPPFDKKTLNYIIRAKIPASDQLFLIGYDENHMFISNLVDKANSVDEAIASLVPKELRGKEYIRQGEFFFQKVPQSELNEKFFKKINDFYSEAIADNIDTLSLLKPYEEDRTSKLGFSDHDVDGFVFADDDSKLQYVIGVVKNERHKALVLPTLHRVYVANEVSGELAASWD